jgi:hypothetical protein
LRTVTRIVIERIEKLPRTGVLDPFHLPFVPGAQVEQRSATSAPLQKLGERPITLGDARSLRPPLLWLGRRYGGKRLTAIDEVRWNAGVAYRLRYGSVTIWNFTRVIPPALAAPRQATPAKPLPIPGNVARFYGSANGRLIVELDTRGRSAAVVGPLLLKEQGLSAIEALHPLR